jgi:hypothetical protein
MTGGGEVDFLLSLPVANPVGLHPPINWRAEGDRTKDLGQGIRYVVVGRNRLFFVWRPICGFSGTS